MKKILYRGHELDERIWFRIKNDQKFKKMFDDCLDDLYQPERLSPEETRKKEDEFIREIMENNPSYYDPKGDLPLVFDKNLKRLSHQEILSLCDSPNTANK